MIKSTCDLWLHRGLKPEKAQCKSETSMAHTVFQGLGVSHQWPEEDSNQKLRGCRVILSICVWWQKSGWINGGFPLWQTPLSVGSSLLHTFGATSPLTILIEHFTVTVCLPFLQLPRQADWRPACAQSVPKATAALSALTRCGFL